MAYPPQMLDAQPVDVQVVRSLDELRAMGRVKSEEETEQRIGMYIQTCSELGIRPGIESLCMALGITRQTLHRWANGENCSQRKQELIQQARQYIYSYLEQVLLSGKGSVVGAIFAFKNWAGYKDSVTIEDARPNVYTGMSPDEIQAQIEKDIPIDVDDYRSDVIDDPIR